MHRQRRGCAALSNSRQQWIPAALVFIISQDIHSVSIHHTKLYQHLTSIAVAVLPWPLLLLLAVVLPQIHQYLVAGRRKPDATHPEDEQTVYRMKLFAANKVKARSLFWYYMSRLNKIKRANGEIVQQQEIFERNPNHVKNFGFWIRYDSRSNTVNMYKEYRDLKLTGAVQKMYADLASKHRARKSSIQILRTAVLKNSECKRPNTQQFHEAKLKFRLLHRIPRSSDKQYKRLFKRQAPGTFF